MSLPRTEQNDPSFVSFYSFHLRQNDSEFELMELDDDLDALNKLPSRASKFAPKSSRFKPKPKSEPEPEPKPKPKPKPEPQEFDVGKTVAPLSSPPHAKPEPNGTAKIDGEPKPELELELKPKPEPEPEEEPMQGDPMAVDEEDAVVREIDVFFTPSIDDDTQLYVLQYPLRPCWRPYELDERCEEVRLKPESSQVEIDLSIDLESNNIDREFASKVNFTKQTLSTKCNPPPTNGYAVGLLMGDKLHLHPVHAIVQLRPSLKHLYSDASKIKNIISTEANANLKVEGSIQEKSVPAPKKQCWVALKYHSSKSDISSRCLQQMVAHESSPMNFTINAYDYVSTLCPRLSRNIEHQGPSKRYLLSLPVEERLKKLLVEGSPLHRFCAIKHFAPEYSDEELLEFLQQHAVLIQGLWTPKTKLLYPQGGEEPLAREIALILFSKNLNVQSSDVKVRAHHGNLVKKMLKTFGSERHDPRKSSAHPAPYWKFREIPDESFKKLYPEIVEKQQEILKTLEEKVFPRANKKDGTAKAQALPPGSRAEAQQGKSHRSTGAQQLKS